MPRNVSGTYTLPLPAVVPNTVIESLWANTTMDDLAAAITNSLDRNGNGGMIAPFRVVDGTESAPGFAYVAETGSGLFRQTTGVVGMSVLGAAKQYWNSGGTNIAGNLGVFGDMGVTGDVTIDGILTLPIGVVGNVLLPDGEPLFPSLAFENDVTTGLYRDTVSGAFGFATGGIERMRIAQGSPHTAVSLHAAAGLASILSLCGNGATPGVLSLDLQQWTDGTAGLVQRANKSLSFYTNGLERLQVAAGGAVGIGVAPTARLTVGALSDPSNNIAVNGSATSYTSVEVIGSGVSSCALYANFSGAADPYGMATGTMGLASVNTIPLAFGVNAGERMRIQSSGDIDIGATVNGWAAANRKVLAVTGANQALIGLRTAGTEKGYVSHDGTLMSVVNAVGGAALQISGTGLLVEGLTGNELGYKGVPHGALELGQLTRNSRGMMVAVFGGFTIATGWSYQAGDTWNIYNATGGNITITQGAGVTLYLAASALTGNRTLASRGMCTVWAYDATNLILTGAGLS